MERPSMVQEMVVLFSWGTTSVRMGASGRYLAIRLAVRPLLAYTTIRPACSSARLGWGLGGLRGRIDCSGLDRHGCCGVGSSSSSSSRVGCQRGRWLLLAWRRQLSMYPSLSVWCAAGARCKGPPRPGLATHAATTAAAEPAAPNCPAVQPCCPVTGASTDRAGARHFFRSLPRNGRERSTDQQARLQL